MIKGTGVSFRSRHWRAIMATEPNIPWMEVLADNFIDAGGMPAYQLDTLADRYPLTLHSIGLSIGSYEPLNFNYLAQLKTLKKRTGAIWLSDHLCFTHAQGTYSHDLLPLPYTEESLKHVVERLDIVQDYLGEAILIENPSSYIDSNTNALSEAEFLYQLVRGSNCRLLLDVNNIYVSQQNRNLNCDDYLSHIPWDSVAEIHLAGFDQQGEVLIDAHNNPVSEPVWQLFKRVIQVLPNVPALVEWDSDLPQLEGLITEQQKAEYIRRQVATLEETPTFQNTIERPSQIMRKASRKMPLDLKQWQKLFVAAIYGDAIASKEMQNHIARLPNISHKDALSIYQKNCKGALLTTLKQCYKVCRQLIGNDAFRQQAALYIERVPSTTQDLNQYGKNFPSHLSVLIEHEPAYSALPYLPDMAVYEYLYQSVYYAPMAAANDLPNSTSVNADLIFVALSKHCRIFTSAYPISEIWQLHEAKNLEQLALLSQKKTEYLLIYRNHNLQIVSTVLAPIHFKLFEQVSITPTPLSHFVSLAETLGLELATFLPQWISAGWLALNETEPLKTDLLSTFSEA